MLGRGFGGDGRQAVVGVTQDDRHGCAVGAVAGVRVRPHRAASARIGAGDNRLEASAGGVVLVNVDSEQTENPHRVARRGERCITSLGTSNRCIGSASGRALGSNAKLLALVVLLWVAQKSAAKGAAKGAARARGACPGIKGHRVEGEPRVSPPGAAELGQAAPANLQSRRGALPELRRQAGDYCGDPEATGNS